MRPIRRNDLVEVIAHEAHISTERAEGVLDALEDELSAAFSAGRSVWVPLVGVLEDNPDSTQLGGRPLHFIDMAGPVATTCGLGIGRVGEAIESLVTLLQTAEDQVVSCFVPFVGHIRPNYQLALQRLANSDAPVWLLQCDPKVFDFESMYRANRELPRSWSAKVRTSEIGPGDRVVFWLSGKNAGVYAIGEVTGVPEPGQLDEEFILTDEHPDWDTFVPFDLYLDLYDLPIKRADLKFDQRFLGESIMAQPWGANAHRVSAAGFEALLERAALHCEELDAAAEADGAAD